MMFRFVSSRRGYSSVASSANTSDVTILGGGAIGCSIAYFLKMRSPSTSVTVIERDPTYTRASSTLSVGSIRQQFSIPENTKMSIFGAEFLRNANELLSVPSPATGDVDEAHVNFYEGGYLFLATPDKVDILTSNYDTQTGVGAEVKLMTREELKPKFPWMNVDDIALGCLGVKNEGWFDPYCLTTSLRKKAASLGVDFVTSSVEKFQSKGNKVESVTVVGKEGSEETISSPLFVNAAGAWSSRVAKLAGLTDCPVRLRKRCVFVFQCKDRSVTHVPLVVDPTGVYFRQEGDLQGSETFIAGVSPPAEMDPDLDENDSDLHLEPDHSIFEDIIWPTIAERVPAFEAIKVVSSWAGLYDYNILDQNAILGYHPHLSNMIFATGFSGHGIQQAPAVGRGITELIIDGEYTSIDLSVFGYDRIVNDEPVFEKNVV